MALRPIAVPAQPPSNQGLIAEHTKYTFAALEQLDAAIGALEVRISPVLVLTETSGGPLPAPVNDSDSEMLKATRSILSAVHYATARLDALTERVSL